MKRPNNILLVICALTLTFVFFSCSKKEEQSKTEEVKVDSAKTGADSVFLSSDSRMTSKDVKKIFGEIKQKYENELDVIGNTEVRFVKLGSDGRETALLYYSLVARGGNAVTGSGIVLYKTDGSKLEFLLDYNLDGAVVKSVKDGQINCVKYEYAAGDPNCCPSKKKPFKLKFEYNKLVFIP
jgi:hypothetical protein